MDNLKMFCSRLAAEACQISYGCFVLRCPIGALALPRQDVKPLAKALLDRFGSFANVLGADAKAMAEVNGIGDAATATFAIVREAGLRLARSALTEKSVLANWDKLIDYCRASMAREMNEQFRVLFLNRRNILIADEVQQRGTVDHTPVYPREVVKRALDLGATAIVMVHNHPSGDPTPSKADIEMTKEVRDAAEKLGIVLHDHIIVSRSGETSFKALGLL